MARMRRLTFVLLSACCVVTASSAQTSRAPQLDSITAADLRADLFFLASDAFQGRLTNTPENGIAADWVRSRFERFALRPGGQGGSFDHRYALMTASLGDGNAMRAGSLRTPSDGLGGLRSELRAGEEFYPHRFSANASVQSSVVFAGFGIVSPERGHDDYRDAVKGQIVLILDREPGVNDPASIFDGVVTAEAAQPIRKVLAAQEKGAIGVIFVEDVHNQSGPASNFECAGRQLLADDRAARRALHVEDLGRSRAHSSGAGLVRGWPTSWSRPPANRLSSSRGLPRRAAA